LLIFPNSKSNSHLLIELVYFLLIPCFLAGQNHHKNGEMTDLDLSRILEMHLASIGTFDSINGIKSRAAEGTCILKTNLLSGGLLRLNSVAALLSNEEIFSVLSEFNHSLYPFEGFIFDGEVIRVAAISPGESSTLGSFFTLHPVILESNLPGGILSTSWPFLDPRKVKSKVKKTKSTELDGQKKVSLDYSSGNPRISLQIFFDPITFRHDATRYRVFYPNGDFSVLTEKFCDFQDFDSLHLPTKWILNLKHSKSFKEFQWELYFNRIRHGPPKLIRDPIPDP
jgi:hypothetical protein